MDRQEKELNADDFCHRCGKTAKTYEAEDGFRLCDDCYSNYMEKIENELRDDPENYCMKCGEFSIILESGKCPVCFELCGYI